jgi:hypothetical protein
MNAEDWIYRQIHVYGAFQLVQSHTMHSGTVPCSDIILQNPIKCGMCHLIYAYQYHINNYLRNWDSAVSIATGCRLDVERSGS